MKFQVDQFFLRKLGLIEFSINCLSELARPRQGDFGMFERDKFEIKIRKRIFSIIFFFSKFLFLNFSNTSKKSRA